MNKKAPLEDPSNRIVAVFDNSQQATAAREEISKQPEVEGKIRVLGEESAEKIDTSAKWFADTDDELQRYQRELRAGNTVISIPISDSDCREKFHSLLKRHDARLVTHFGEWITEMMR